MRIGKQGGGYFLYKPGEGWVRDVDNVITDKLMGYDPSEPADSPYKMFNMSIMDQIETISEEQARTHQAKLDREDV